MSELDLFTEEVPVVSMFIAVKANAYGVNIDDQAVFGLTLEPYGGEYGYNPISEAVSIIGNEADIAYPEEGLVEGEKYLVQEICTSTDRETGYCDDTKIIISKAE